MYTVDLTLRNNLIYRTSNCYKNWPPHASDITGENIRKLASPLLFNFMAWILGFSDDPEDADYIELDEQTTSKIFSLCQDLVYISNKRKVQTPKSLAMTI